MKRIGIWLDKREATIITLSENQELIQKIESKIEEFHIGGGSGTRFKGGPQDVVQDSRYLEREKHQFKQYFDAIINKLQEADVLALFGPAETAPKLFKEMEQSNAELAQKVKTVQKADSMTENQTIALIRDYFHKKN